MRSPVKILLPFLPSLALLTGCGGAARSDTGPSPVVGAEKAAPASPEADGRKTGYLHTGDGSATFIQWAKTDRQIKGQMQVLDLKRDGKTDSRWFSFEGVFDGDNVSLTFRDRHLTFLEGRTVTGTLKGDSLTLVWPQSDGTLWTQELHPASVAEYNNAARKLQERAMGILVAREEDARRAAAARAEADRIAGEKRAVVDAQNRIIGIANSLGAALKELPGADFYADVLSDYSNDWRQMREAHADMLEESRKTLTSYQLGTVKYKLGTVKYRLGTVRYRNGSFDYRVNSAIAKIRDAEEEIARLQSAFAQLQQAVAANTTGEPRVTITAEQITRAVESARSGISKAVAAREAAKSKAAEYDKQAADLYRQAEAFVKTLRPIDR